MQTIIENADKPPLDLSGHYSKEFDVIYSHIKPFLKSLEKERIKVLLIILLGIFIPSILFIGNIIFIHHLLLGIISFICLFVSFFLYHLVNDKYKSSYKKLIVQKLVAGGFPSLTYKADKCIPEKVFHQSKLFSDEISEYSGEDLISGETKSCAFSLSDVKACESYDDKDGKRKNDIVFSGAFFTATCNIPFTGELFLYPKNKNFYWQDSFVAAHIENNELEEHFTIYSNNGIVEEKLSPQLITAVVNMKQSIRASIYISITSSNLYIAIDKNLFEPTYFSSNANRKHIYKSYSLVSQLIGFVDQIA